MLHPHALEDSDRMAKDARMLGDLKILARLLRLSRRYWGWMALGALLSSVTVLANIGLLAVAGWFLTQRWRWPGPQGVLINYFLPAALIRLFAILRAGGRYLERLVTHESDISPPVGVRVWFYERTEPLAPARLPKLPPGAICSAAFRWTSTLTHATCACSVPALSQWSA
jgi:ATP-binding cassette subfamily C protein CydC